MNGENEVHEADKDSAVPQWVAGVDGCSDGWVVVLLDRHTGEYSARVVPTFLKALELPEAPGIVAVDMPIGLLDGAQTGGRACEKHARQLIGLRRSSVFSAPSRSALAAFRRGLPYSGVSAANRGNNASPGLSKQAFCILGKISEVDAALSPGLQGIVREVHPELCFTAANGGTPMKYSKRAPLGQDERAKLLATLGILAPLQLLGPKPPRGVTYDDLLDASIACWTAERIATGHAIVIPSEPLKDSRGLRMELWR